MKSKDLKNIIKNSEEFNPREEVWGKIKANKETIFTTEIIKVKKERYNMKAKKGIMAAAAFICIVGVAAIIFSIIQPVKAKSTDLMKGISMSSNIPKESSLSSDFIKSTSSFSMELFKQTALDNNNKGNVLISPTSMYLALGLTLNGADGETKKLMEKALGKYGLTRDTLNINCKTLMEELGQKNGDTVMNFANSVWYDKNFSVKKDFLQKNADYFNAGAYNLDFKDKNAANNINNWVKDNTNNLIDKMVDKIPDDAVMYLINTVYFNGKWEIPFDAQDTNIGNFKGENGTMQVDFMSQIIENSSIKENGEQSVLLPYKNGRYSFLAMLPKENTDVRTYLKSFDENTIKNIMNEMRKGEVELLLPKFNSEFDGSMKDELTNMGLGNIFSEEEANFNKMGNGNIYVSEVKQKTFIKVGEKGTEAAAATKVEMKLGSAPIKIIISFNRPFIYAIVDNKTKLPIFLGIMEDPNEK